MFRFILSLIIPTKRKYTPVSNSWLMHSLECNEFSRFSDFLQFSSTENYMLLSVRISLCHYRAASTVSSVVFNIDWPRICLITSGITSSMVLTHYRVLPNQLSVVVLSDFTLSLKWFSIKSQSQIYSYRTFHVQKQFKVLYIK